MGAYGGAIFAYCRSMLDDRSQADDLLQLVFLQAFGALPTFEARSSFKTWLFGIARHRCLDEIKRGSRHSRRLSELRADQVESPRVTSDSVLDQQQVTAEREAGLDDCMQRLPADTRDLVLLRFRHDLSYEEIAALVGPAAGTLRVRIFRALASLRRCLEGKGLVP
jgi:RNA polymerase sigma-70 factor (ECF subfamily)